MRVFAFAAAVSIAVIACAPADESDLGDSTSDLTACAPPPPACDDATGPKVDAVGFDHLKSTLASKLGDPNHRGRDVITTPGEPQWIIGKIAYGLTDKDLEDEKVEIFVQRGCAGAWESLGSTRTADEGTRPAVEGVDDAGGRVFFQIPSNKALPIGRHRVRMVVVGDGTHADILVDVLPKHAPIVISDVDGTLTSSENAEFPALLTGNLPAAQPDAAAVLQGFAKKGYRVVYVSARADRLVDRTHAFLRARGFPDGPVHVTTTALGVTGDAAAAFKSGEFQRIEGHGLTIAWGFGNTASDTQAYDAANVQPLDHRVFLQFTDSAHGGRRIERYADLLPVVNALPLACK